MPVNPTVRKLFSRTHTFWYRLSGGRLGSSMRGVPILLLTTTGRKSGQERTTPLQGIEDGDNIVVIASNGGHTTDPQWWLNLKANPQARVLIKNQERIVIASEAHNGERERIWQKALSQFPGYADYEKTAQRPIPVVVLTPASDL
ncbi:MAG TPA: nitroreductase family deazaflavin-dependent oxidoreductase [Dehalococcoidia bacterium]|nr:nitroreductase family deazaflavin-dependent oxidoreductase [Dehalococcoidia bacterium]